MLLLYTVAVKKENIKDNEEEMKVPENPPVLYLCLPTPFIVVLRSINIFFSLVLQNIGFSLWKHEKNPGLKSVSLYSEDLAKVSSVRQ